MSYIEPRQSDRQKKNNTTSIPSRPLSAEPDRPSIPRILSRYLLCTHTHLQPGGVVTRDRPTCLMRKVVFILGFGPRPGHRGWSPAELGWTGLQGRWFRAEIWIVPAHPAEGPGGVCAPPSSTCFSLDGFPNAHDDSPVNLMRGEGYSGQTKTFLLLLTWPICVFTNLPFLENDTHSLTQRKWRSSLDFPSQAPARRTPRISSPPRSASSFPMT